LNETIGGVGEGGMEGKGKKRKTKSVDAMQQQNDYFFERDSWRD
jgi:hypothetical protein